MADSTTPNDQPAPAPGAAATAPGVSANQGTWVITSFAVAFSGWLVMLLIPLCWLVRHPAGGTAAVAAE
jgi:hypothetical protein